MVPIVCITGCSSGFGQHIALEAALSCNVIATVRTNKDKEILNKLALQHDLNIDIQLCDITDQSSITTLINHISAHYTHCDILINNAGVVCGGFFEDYSFDQIQHVIQTNVLGLMAMTKSCLPLLRASHHAKIINMSSISGCVGIPGLSIYNASKWAVEGFSEALCFELKPFNIDVVLIEPGQFKTAIFEKNLHIAHHADNEKSPYYEFSQIAFKRVQKKLHKHLKDPQKVAKLCLRIIHNPRPRLRYCIGYDARLRLYLKKCLPFEWYRWLVQRSYTIIMKKAIVQ